MRPLLTAGLVFLAAISRAADPCADAYTAEEHQAKWEIARAAWADACRKRPDPSKNLETFVERFIEACLEDALPSIQAGYYHEADARALCAEGAPGRAKIEPAVELPRSPGSEAALAATRSGTHILSTAVEDAMKAGGVASLYGERGGSPGAAAPAAVGGEGAKAGGAGLAPAPRARGLDGGIAPPLPDPVAQRALNVKTLQSRVVADGVSKAAADQARFVLGEMLGKADPAVVQNLVDKKVYAYIIPKDGKLTDLAPFKRLKGQKTFDGRPWEGVRGAGNTSLPGGGHALAVAEESLLADRKPGEGYPRNYVFIHEYGHMVQIHGLPTRAAAPRALPARWRRMGAAFAAYAAEPDKSRAASLGRLAYGDVHLPASFAETFQRFRASAKRKGQSTLGGYADANEKEFFAELTAAYFDVGFEQKKYNDLRRLLKERPELALLMYRVYGPASGLRGK